MRDGEETERGWGADESEKRGERAKSRLKIWEKDRREREGGRTSSYSRLCHDVNDNEAGTVDVELLQQVYLKPLQHGAGPFLRGSWAKEKSLNSAQSYEGQTPTLGELVKKGGNCVYSHCFSNYGTRITGNTWPLCSGTSIIYNIYKKMK